MARAQGEFPLNLDNGSIVITSTGVSQAGAAEVPHVGGYIVSSSATNENTVQVISGTHHIILNNTAILLPALSATSLTSASTVCAFSISNNADVILSLQGDSSLRSAAGYAGLYVETGSRLTIDGNGHLTTTGGAGQTMGTYYYGGGAGIGGNGYIGSSNFGSVALKSGTITAVGGETAKSENYGAAAGIGTGGLTGGQGTSSTSYPFPQGNISIYGGEITAYGGVCVNSSDTCGGAGIGSGGIGDQWEPFLSYINIEIHGGNTTAYGKNDGAGVGGGANCNSGAILIDGGSITAHGGDEGDGSTWGGAGIGAGDMAWADNISIGGNTTVFARGGGAAAGIGGGNYGGVWNLDTDTVGTLVISDNAVVTAFGGSSGTNRGGAGIGAGRNYGSTHCNSGVIAIKDNAVVTAYAGINAQAIGVGSGYNYSTAIPGEDILNMVDTITLKAFNQDTVQTAYPPDIQGSGAPNLVAFTLADSALSGVFPNAGVNTQTTSHDNLTWEYSGTAGNYLLTIYDISRATAAIPSVHTAFGNWAVLLAAPQRQFYSLAIQADTGGSVDTTVSGSYAAGDAITITATADANYDFNGWTSDNGGTFTDATDDVTTFIMPAANVTVTAGFKAMTPTTYHVIYSANGGAGNYVGPDIRSGEKDTVLSPDETGISRINYSFAGWNTASDGSGASYMAGDTLILYDNVTLHAQWISIPTPKSSSGSRRNTEQAESADLAVPTNPIEAAPTPLAERNPQTGYSKLLMPWMIVLSSSLIIASLLFWMYEKSNKRKR